MAALSLKYRLIRKAVRLLGIKKTFQQPRKFFWKGPAGKQ